MTAQLMQAVAANGGDQLDHSALVQGLELMAPPAQALATGCAAISWVSWRTGLSRWRRA